MFLNGIHVPGILSLKTLIAKMVGIVFTIAGGIIAGKEGPFVHAGAIVGGGVGLLGSDWITRISHGRWTVKLPRWMGGYHRNPVDHRDFTAIGTAIGIAVAFNSPIGGLLFTVEEGASFYSRSSFWRAFLATGVAVMAVNVIFVAMNQADEASLFGLLHEETGMGHQFELQGGFYYRLWELPIFALIGACGGVAGAALVTYQSRMGLLRAKYCPPAKKWRRIAEVMFMAFLTASIWYAVLATSKCLPMPNSSVDEANATAAVNTSFVDDNLGYLKQVEHFNDVTYVDAGRLAEELAAQTAAEEEHRAALRPQLQCPDGEFNKFAQLFFTDLGGALRRLVVLGHEVPNDVIFPWDVVGLYYLLAQVMFIVAYGIGAPAGLFVPTLTFGAAFGLFAAHGVRATFGHWWSVPISFHAYAVIGSAAFLGGTTRMIVSVTVLVAETTGAAGLMIPIMVANFCAKLVGDMFNHSIYDFAMFTKGAPLLEEAALFPHQKMIMDKLQASEMMTTHIVALPLRPTLGEVIDTLRTCTHSTIAVTPTPELARNGQPFELHGVIRVSQLLRILKYRLGVMSEEQHAAHEAQIRERHRASGGTNGESFDARPVQLDNATFEQMLPAMIVAAESHRTNLEMLQLMEEIPVKIYTAEQKQILEQYTPEECDTLRVCIEAFMDRESTVVCGIETLSKTYNLFRTMGHHHVFVTNDHPVVQGLICRKDLLEDIAKLKLGEKANRCKMSVLDDAITLSTIPFLPVDGQKKRKNKVATGAQPQAGDDDEEMDHTANGVATDEEDSPDGVVETAPRSPPPSVPSPSAHPPLPRPSVRCCSLLRARARDALESPRPNYFYPRAPPRPQGSGHRSTPLRRLVSLIPLPLSSDLRTCPPPLLSFPASPIVPPWSWPGRR
eukprot:TRINITY_DN3028_c0_g1_i2.p1 TRINITY_DN3028_c0_g1~~TRINITY_DN3028_c0_g1_i2.p1  ORF type:complete len:985 (-),score=333.70 TRINITY_DN3028_c0_g1_i2:137-2827(-)